jgi:hypothetical protein
MPTNTFKIIIVSFLIIFVANIHSQAVGQPTEYQSVKVQTDGLEWPSVPAMTETAQRSQRGGQAETALGVNLNNFLGMSRADNQGLITVSSETQVRQSSQQVTLIAANTAQTKELTTDATKGFIVKHGPDFDTPLGVSGENYVFPDSELPNGYQSTAEITARFYKNGQEQTITNPVTWTIESVRNEAPSWNRAPGDMNGLAWGEAEVHGTKYWDERPVIGGTSTTTAAGVAEVKLTDVVGQRTVTLKAETTIGGVTYSDTAVITFGKGPLSVFTKRPTVGKKWAMAAGIPDTADLYSGDFTALTNQSSFPAAALCGGIVHTGSSDITIGSSEPKSYSADFKNGKNLNHWRDGDILTKEYYSTTSNLPTLGQLVAVSAYYGGYHTNVKRKGAALAAGWPDDAYHNGYYHYWTGQVGFDSIGYFSADNVYLSDGSDVYWEYVTNLTPVVVCVQ